MVCGKEFRLKETLGLATRGVHRGYKELLPRPSNVVPFWGLVWLLRLGLLFGLPERYYIGGSFIEGL